jgi:hypothetical protein
MDRHRYADSIDCSQGDDTGGVDVSGAVRASAADYRENYITAFGGSHRQFSYYTQAET